MSKTLRTIGTISAAVALVATAVVTANPKFLALSAKTIATLKTVAAVASVTAAAAAVGAQITAPKPIARGSPATVVIDIEPPRPYIVGQVMAGGVLRYDAAYGATLNRVPNPYRWQVRVLSGVGPIQGIVGEYFDFAPITGFYTGHFNGVQQLGQRPEAAALVPPFGAAPGWGSDSKLSGCAAVGLNFKFDRDGERFAAGLPNYTALVDGEKAYDPRLDSTYPGGSGACRLGNEATYVFTRNPALHAATYAFGRFEAGKRVFGLGLSSDAIDWPAVVDWANDCDSNAWTANMILLEGGTGSNLREQRVRNLDDLCAAGGARWFQAGAQLSFDWHRPRVSLATLTDEDILEAGGGTDAVQTVRDRMNGVRPQYISPDHNWQQITAAEIVGSTYRTEDGGQPLTQVYPLNGVTNPTQAGQLAAYFMADSRELGPMDVQATAAWRFYRPGDCITIDSSLIAYQGQAVINQRALGSTSLAVSLSMKSETPGKHAFALGRTATPPPSPVLAQTAEERDLIASAAMRPRAVDAAPGSTRNVARGTYDAGETYVRGDEVILSGSSYRLIVDSSTGNPPPDAARWALIAAAGSGPPGADGQAGITITATNQAHNVPTEADGSGGDYSTAGGTMILRRGTTVLAPTFSIAAQSPNTGWISIDAATGVYTVGNPGATLGTATLRAAVGGVNYDITYTIAKTLRGVAGPNLTLVADAQAFTFTDLVANPSSQTITLQALLTNLSGTATWSTSPAVTLGGSGNTRTLSVADFGTNRQVTVEATRDGITDRVTLVRLERNIVAPNAANRVPFSRMEGGRGWAVNANPAGLAVDLRPLESDGLRFPIADVTFTAAGQTVVIGGNVPFPVNGDERLSMAAGVDAFAITGANPASWRLYVDFIDEDDVPTQETIAEGVGATSTFTRRESFETPPATTRRAVLQLQVTSGGAGVVRMGVRDAMVASAAAGQTLHPAFTPGPNADDGADVTANAVPSLDALPGQVFQADHLGNLSFGQLPRPVQATRRRGTVVVSASTSWSVEATNCTASISAAGLVSITAVSGNGQVRVISTRDGVELRASFDVAVQRAAPPASGGGGTGTSASTSSLSGAPGGNVWTDITGDLVVTTGSAGEAGLGAALEFFPNITFPSTGFNLYDAELRWRRQTSPGVWEVVGAAATPNSSAQVETDLGNVIFQSNGTIVCNRTATGLGASASQTFRLQARAADAMFWFGGASATGN